MAGLSATDSGNSNAERNRSMNTTAPAWVAPGSVVGIGPGGHDPGAQRLTAAPLGGVEEVATGDRGGGGPGRAEERVQDRRNRGGGPGQHRRSQELPAVEHADLFG